MPPAYTFEQLEILQSAADIFGISLLSLVRRCCAPESRTLTPEDSPITGAADGSSPAGSFETEHITNSPPSSYGQYNGAPVDQTFGDMPNIPEYGMLQWSTGPHIGPQNSFMPAVTLPRSMEPFGSLSGDVSPGAFDSLQSSANWDNLALPLATAEQDISGYQAPAVDFAPPFQGIMSISPTSSGESSPLKRKSPEDDLANRTKHVLDRAKRSRTSSCEDVHVQCVKNNRRSLQLAGPGKRACVRCKMQRIECPIDPADPSGDCLRCKKLETGKRCLVQLPCLRYRIPDAVLYRPGSTLRLYSDFPFEGSEAGKLRYTVPVPRTDRWIDIRQGNRASIKLRMRRFSIASQQLNIIEAEKRPLYDHPFELADSREAAQATIRHVREHLDSYIWDGMRADDPISSLVFGTALHTARTKPKNLIRDTLGLWAACRLSEGDWRICGNETLGLSLENDGNVSLTPLMNAQLHASDIMDVIGPFTEDTLRRLEQQIQKKDDFFEIFLCIYVLMHNYELMVARQRKVAVKRRCQYRFTNMRFIANIHSGAKTMLAYFHYICGGWRPFALDWDSVSTSGPFGQLTTEQRGLMKKLKAFALAQGDYIDAITRSHRYEERFWFIGQLFDHSWKPRDTFEQSFELADS